MADIFISYAREDRDVAERLAGSLETYGWSVFWDRRTPAGRRFRDYIAEELDAAHCVVTLWSPHGIASHWVCEESDEALNRGILVPVRIGQVTPPLGFRSIQCAELIDWVGDEDHPGFRQMMDDLEANLGAPPDRPSPRSTRVQEPEAKQTTERRREAKPKAAVREPEMVTIEPGSFVMGSDEFGVAKPRHKATIGYRFEMGKYPVIFAEYDAFCEAAGREKPDDEGWGRGRRPIINVSWNDAQGYIDWLSKESGKMYRLPSEAEWEYCCRSGTTTRYSFGDTITDKNAKYEGKVGKTTEVGR